MNRRHIAGRVAVIAAVVVALGHPWAGAASDLYGNVGPGGSLSGLADRYPLGHYALDQHFSAVKASLTGGIDASGVPAMIAFFLANLTWQITAFAANALITLFSFAFSLDLLNGSQATGGAGALAPVSDAIGGLYANTFGRPWMVIAVTLAGCWAMWHALVQRRYTETAGALGMSLAFCLIALAIVTRPDETIGQASRLTNQLSTAFLAVTARGEVTGGDQARRGAADQLFALLIYRPWVALNFGGTEHCVRVGSGDADHDPVSLPVRPLSADPATDARLRHQLQTTGRVTTREKACVENTVRYPPHFLRFAPGSEDRDAEYQALNDADPGELPDPDPAKATGAYEPAVVDKPVTDAMEKGGQDQRLLLALLILVGELGAFLLLGALSVSVLLAQVVVLLLACFAPVALVAGIVPGRGHEAFKAWGARLGSYLVRKAAYSLVLAVLLAVLSALQDATTNLGWLMSFGLQALLLWTVYLQRHTLAGQLINTVAGHHPERDAQLRRLLGLHHATRAVAAARRRRPTTPPPAQRPEPSIDPSTTADDPPELTDVTAAAAPLAAPTAETGTDPAVINRQREPRRPARAGIVEARGEHEQSRARANEVAREPRRPSGRSTLPAPSQAGTTTGQRPGAPSPPLPRRPRDAESSARRGADDPSARSPQAEPPARAQHDPTGAEHRPPAPEHPSGERSLADELRADGERLEDHHARPDPPPRAASQRQQDDQPPNAEGWES